MRSSTSSQTSTMVEKLCSSLNDAAGEFVAWFEEQMPEAYFANTDEKTRLEHMRAILALRASGVEPRMRIRSGDGRQITYVLPNDYPGMLTDLMNDFGDELIRSAKLYSAKDGQLVIDIFEVGAGEPCNFNDPAVISKLDATVKSAREQGLPWSDESLREHFARLSNEYVKACHPSRILHHAMLFREVSASSGSSAVIDNTLYPKHSRIIVAVSNAPAKRMVVRISNRLKTLSVNVDRAYVDAIQAGEQESVVIISAVVQGPDGGQIDENSPLWKRLKRDLLRLKWLDDETLAFGYAHSELGLGSADIIHTYCDLVHQIMVKENRYVFTRQRIREVAEQYMSVSIRLANHFKARFDPERPLDEADGRLRANRIRESIEHDVEDEVARRVLQRILDAMEGTLKTNFYVVGRYALSLRIDPTLMMPKQRNEAGNDIPLPAGAPGSDATEAERPETPFGVFFVHGRDFNAFHVRFRDTSRGGVRVVRPPSNEHYIRESERHFDEVYALAYAQQLKNKDIPEGGAKAVILVRPGQTITRCVRGFADSMLDLISTDASHSVVDRLGITEHIYFGPDENITPEHINWIVSRAEKRGYPYPNALMSSKPGAGINHKEYGVTSEGVNVFLEEALNFVGIDPRTQPFSVKITGGPDGDVAGNEIRILIREFGNFVKIAGIADGFGCAEDPEGLDHSELLRLVRNGLPIAEFDPSKLSREGRLTRVSDPEGVRLRNEMHNRVKTDAFVPAGGRPSTINGYNWKKFIDEQGVPASRVIVEGANLFLTPEARRRLFEAGVLIVKDSSANKCGVICSSFEIMACLMLSEEEFLEIKTEYVEEVLDRLRTYARLEARTLFQEHMRRPGTSVVDLGIELSREINRVTDAISADFDRLSRAQPELVREITLSHVPPILQWRAGERIWTQLPETYRAQIVCSAIASRIVYREGLEFFREMPFEHLAQFACEYMLRAKEIEALAREVERSSLPRAAEVARLLEIGGTRASLQDRL